MKFYLQYNTLNYKVRHAVAVALKELYPEAQFAALVSSLNNVAEDFLKSQKDIEYVFIVDQDKVVNDALKTQADIEMLKRFEENIKEKSLWRFFAMDRGWCSQYLRGIYMPRMYAQTINTQKNVLKVASGLIKFHTQFFDEFEPNVFIPAAGQNSMTCPILEQICKRNGCLYVLPETVRTQNYMAITDNRQCTFPQVDELCRKLINREVEIDSSEGEKCYADITKDLLNSDYFDKSDVSYLKWRFPFLRFVAAATKTTVQQIIRWFKEAKTRESDTIFRQPNDLKTFFYNIYFGIVKQYRRMQLLNPKFYTEYNPDQKYIYFPLHCSNEYSTQVQGNMWVEQLQIIDALSKSIPCDWKLVVKEHPGMLLWRVRYASFYKELKNFTNVDFIPTDTNSNMVIQNAQMIVTIVGTTGWEAIMRGKPVISLEENMFDVLGLSRICTDFKQLSVAIYEELKRTVQISEEERQRRITCLLTAIIKYSVWVEDPNKVTGDVDTESQEEALAIGRDVAAVIKNFIEYQNQEAELVA